LVNIWDDNHKVIIPEEIVSIDNDNINVIFSSPVAGSVNVAKGGHFISGSVPLSNISNLGYTASFTNQTTWSVNHNLGTDYPLVTIWNNDRDVVVPTRINSVDSNNVIVYFSTNQTGFVVVGRVI
jgi:hypothetical protein